jgi:hypothetical protein
VAAAVAVLVGTAPLGPRLEVVLAGRAARHQSRGLRRHWQAAAAAGRRQLNPLSLLAGLVAAA